MVSWTGSSTGLEDRQGRKSGVRILITLPKFFDNRISLNVQSRTEKSAKRRGGVTNNTSGQFARKLEV